MLTVVLATAALSPIQQFGRPLDAVAKDYGAIKKTDSVVISHSRRETRVGKLGKHDVFVTAHDGRVSELEFVFGERSSIAPGQALTAVGISPKGVVFKENELRTYAEVMIRDYFVSGGGLGKAQGVFTRNSPKVGGPEQILNLQMPSSVYFAPTLSERKAILDGLRTPVQKAFRGQPVEFVVDRITTVRGWAFVYGVPGKRGGGKLDLTKSDFADMAKEGMYDDNVSSLLRLTNGKWIPKALVIGATDVPWVNWSDEYSVPRLLFFDSLD